MSHYTAQSFPQFSPLGWRLCSGALHKVHFLNVFSPHHKFCAAPVDFVGVYGRGEYCSSKLSFPHYRVAAGRLQYWVAQQWQHRERRWLIAFFFQSIKRYFGDATVSIMGFPSIVSLCCIQPDETATGTDPHLRVPIFVAISCRKLARWD